MIYPVNKTKEYFNVEMISDNECYTVARIDAPRNIIRKMLACPDLNAKEVETVESGYPYVFRQSADTGNNKHSYEWLQKQKTLIAACSEVYKWALENGIDEETARSMLPEGMQKSTVEIECHRDVWKKFLSEL